MALALSSFAGLFLLISYLHGDVTMRISPLIAATFVVTACSGTGGSAGSPPAPAQRPPERTIFVDTDGSLLGTGGAVLTTRAEDGVTRTTLPVAADSAMRLLLKAYEGSGIQVTLLEPTHRRLGNPQFVAQKRMVNEAITRIVRCGETITGPRAESDRVMFSLVSSVKASGAGKSEIETRLEATALPIASGNSSGPQVCTTTGLLESRVHGAAVLLLKGR